MMNWTSFSQQVACGAISAAGFGVLFNVGFRTLGFCAASGGLALGVRTLCLEFGSSLEGASFAAALAVGVVVRLLHRWRGVSPDVLDAVGCIPMIPGSFAAKAVIGLFAVTTSAVADEAGTLVTAAQNTLRVLFAIGAIGTGLAIPSQR